MNAEYLLDAVGRLDDGLIREAERYRRPKARYGRLLGWAASFAVVILLGYGATHFGMGGGAPDGGMGGGAGTNGGNAFPGGYSGAPGSSMGYGPGEAFDPENPASPSVDNQSGGAQGAPPGTIFVRGAQGSGTYILSGEILAELPEGGGYAPLGELLALEAGSPRLCTDVEEYVGLDLWAEDGGRDLPPAVYVELPAGGFARAGLVGP